MSFRSERMPSKIITSLQLEEDDQFDAGPAALGVELPRPLPDKREIKFHPQVAVEVVGRDEVLQRDSDRLVEAAGFGWTEHGEAPDANIQAGDYEGRRRGGRPPLCPAKRPVAYRSSPRTSARARALCCSISGGRSTSTICPSRTRTRPSMTLKATLAGWQKTRAARGSWTAPAKPRVSTR